MAAIVRPVRRQRNPIRPGGALARPDRGVGDGYPAAFALTGALILAAVPVALRERKAVASA